VAEVRKRAPAENATPRLLIAALCVGIGVMLCSASLQSILDSSLSATSLLSKGLWNQAVESLGSHLRPVPGPDGEPVKDSQGQIVLEAQINFTRLLVLVVSASIAGWLGGAWWISRQRETSFAEAAAHWGILGGAWAIIGGSWELARLTPFLTGVKLFEVVVLVGPVFWFAFAVAGWLATLLVLARPTTETALSAEISDRKLRVPTTVWVGYGAYVVIFVAMNWQLYRGA
jgi:hypothetical protein